MQVEVITDRERWNRFVEAQATGNITQTWEWAELGARLGSQALRLGAVEDGELRAALLVIVEKAPVVGQPYLYAPRGPVCDDPTSPALAALLDHTRSVAKAHGAFMLKLEPNVADGDQVWLDALQRLGLRRNPFATHPRRSWVLDITPDETTLLANMKEKWRYNVRLAGRKGVTVRASLASDDIATFYTLYRETADRDGIFIHERSHYEDFLRLYGERDAAALLMAEYEGQPIAALIVARCGPVATYMFGASSNRERNRMPNHLLQWTAIRWGRERGCRLYDFRAIAETLEPGEDMYSLYTYKQGFGGYSLFTLETHDLVTQPAVYWAYMRALRMKRRVIHWRQARAARQRFGAQATPSAASAKDAAPSANKQE
ncbi:MAG: lipid II:glycine glycyltransferase FemX [Ktedonobacterales bacterium]|jgi:lipid II:glycine glycyltransferase (peptidoglycan interpeptide bridge formation enzyme)